MTEYRRNHTIPRALLEFWANPTYKAEQAYHIPTRRRIVLSGHGSSRFSFAAVNDLHIPVENGRRLVQLEKWFSELEDALVPFAKQAHARKIPLTFNKHIDVTKTLMALLGLECRSRYNLELIQRALERDKKLRRLIAGNEEASAKKTTLENLIQSVSEQVGYVTPPKFSIFHAPKNRSWIMSDRPFFGVNGSFRGVVLTNKVFVAYRRAEENEMLCGHFDASEEQVDAFNREIALNARDWIVAETRELLEEYAALTTTDEWKQRVAEDHLTGLPIVFSETGWAITR